MGGNACESRGSSAVVVADDLSPLCQATRNAEPLFVLAVSPIINHSPSSLAISPEGLPFFPLPREPLPLPRLWFA